MNTFSWLSIYQLCRMGTVTWHECLRIGLQDKLAYTVIYLIVMKSACWHPCQWTCRHVIVFENAILRLKIDSKDAAIFKANEEKNLLICHLHWIIFSVELREWNIIPHLNIHWGVSNQIFWSNQSREKSCRLFPCEIKWRFNGLTGIKKICNLILNSNFLSLFCKPFIVLPNNFKSHTKESPSKKQHHITFSLKNAYNVTAEY